MDDVTHFLEQSQAFIVAAVGVIQLIKGWDFWKRKKAEKRKTPPPIPHSPM